MIDEHPHQVQSQSARHAATSSAGQLAAAAPSVFSALRFDEDDEQAVLVETREPDGCYPRIPEARPLEHGIKVRSADEPGQQPAGGVRLPDARPRTGGRQQQ
jgi:hypothetical protein